MRESKKRLDSAPAHIIPIAPAAQPVPNLPRLRALALFGRRSVEPAEPPCCRRPKTITGADFPRYHWRFIFVLQLSLGPSAETQGKIVCAISSRITLSTPTDVSYGAGLTWSRQRR